MNPVGGGRGGMKRAAENQELQRPRQRDFLSEPDEMRQREAQEPPVDPAAAIIARLDSGLITPAEAQRDLAAVATSTHELPEPPNPFSEHGSHTLADPEREAREMAMALEASSDRPPQAEHAVPQTRFPAASEKNTPAVHAVPLTEEEQVSFATHASLGLPPPKIQRRGAVAHDPPKQPSMRALQEAGDHRPAITVSGVVPTVEIGKDEDEDDDLELAKALSLGLAYPPSLIERGLSGEKSPRSDETDDGDESDDSGQRPYLAPEAALRGLRALHAQASTGSADHDSLKQMADFYEALEAPLWHHADVLGLTHLAAPVFERAVAGGDWSSAMAVLDQSGRAPVVIMLPEGSHVVPPLPGTTSTLQLLNPPQAPDLSGVPDDVVVELIHTGAAAYTAVAAPDSIVVHMLQCRPELLAKFDELRRALHHELSSGAITVDQRRELRSVLNALWRSATSKEGYLDLNPCPLDSLRLANKLGLFAQAMAEMAKTRTHPMRFHFPAQDTALFEEIQEIVALCTWPVILPGSSRTATPLAPNTASSDTVAREPSTDPRQARQQLGVLLSELRSGIAPYLEEEEEQRQFHDFLSRAEHAVTSGAGPLDCTNCPRYALELLANTGLFGAVGDHARSTGLPQVEVTLPPGTAALPGLEEREGKFFVQL